MTAWRYEISLRVLKNIFPTLFRASDQLNEKFMF